MPQMMTRKMTDLLLKNSLMTKEQLEQAMTQMEKEGTTLRDILVVQSNKIDEEIWMSLISQEFGIPSLNLSKYNVDSTVGKLIPEEIAKKHQVLPISKLGETLVVAVVEPPDVIFLDDLKQMTQCKIELVLVRERDIKQTLDRVYLDSSEKLAQMIEEAKKSPQDVALTEEIREGQFTIEQAAQEGQQAPIIRLVDAIIAEGLNRRASDIHIEPYENQVRVRYRVDGVLQEGFGLPKRGQNAVLARLKLMSGVDITESRVPQDGRFKIKFQKREIDFRVSILPVGHGGKVVMRVLDRGNLSVGLDQLGFSPDTLEKFEEAIRKPFGMILITGPTGSGKSTTLYSILAQLNTPEKNIITVEDPVEYQVDGITQIQTKSEIGLTFASGLRSILRQTPDVVMVGEVRDFETADIAIKASLTGQLVLSTLHTNDAPGAITRLIDMGVEPFLIASSVILVAAQRLCRKICSDCKVPIEFKPDSVRKMGWDLGSLEGKTFYRGRGCDRCRQNGYRGRIAIFEVLVIDDRVREKIISKAATDEIKEYAIKHQGMRTLREDGWMKCYQGITTLDEISRITSEG